VHVGAPPDVVYGLVTDVRRMGEWSPETYKAEWVDGAAGPAIGARFKGFNRRGLVRWSTTPRVVAATPGSEFAFVIESGGKETVKWVYRLEPDDGGTRLTESFELLNDTSRVINIGHRVMGVKDRTADLEQGMLETIQRVKAAAERSS
jgi:hypothetical protein